MKKLRQFIKIYEEPIIKCLSMKKLRQLITKSKKLKPNTISLDKQLILCHYD